MKNKLELVSGSLHSHGFWSDYRNKHEIFFAPFDLDYFVKTCVKYGRDFQAITDIMANWKGKPEFQENRYNELISTAKLNNEYQVDYSKTETKITFENGEIFYIPRTQEILTSTPRKHILGLNLEKNISGGRNAKEILNEIKNEGGYAIIDHPFACGAWQKEELLELYENNLITALEWNGGLTIPGWLPDWVNKFAPTKKANKKVLKLAPIIPVIANDDARCVSDVKKGAYTTYLINANHPSLSKELRKSITHYNPEFGNLFFRTEQYSRWDSIWTHVLNGRISMLTLGKYGLPDA